MKTLSDEEQDSTRSLRKDGSHSRRRYEKRRDLRTVVSPAIRLSAQAAMEACLRYASAREAGIIRQPKRFAYLGYEGKPVRDSDTLRRIRSMVTLPPGKMCGFVRKETVIFRTRVEMRRDENTIAMIRDGGKSGTTIHTGE